MSEKFIPTICTLQADKKEFRTKKKNDIFPELRRLAARMAGVPKPSGL